MVHILECTPLCAAAGRGSGGVGGEGAARRNWGAAEEGYRPRHHLPAVPAQHALPQGALPLLLCFRPLERQVRHKSSDSQGLPGLERAFVASGTSLHYCTCKMATLACCPINAAGVTWRPSYKCAHQALHVNVAECAVCSPPTAD